MLTVLSRFFEAVSKVISRRKPFSAPLCDKARDLTVAGLTFEATGGRA
jgi:hypothetical protein